MKDGTDSVQAVSSSDEEVKESVNCCFSIVNDYGEAENMLCHANDEAV
jgi:hypothetical protein